MSVRDLVRENDTIEGFRAGVTWAVGSLHKAADVVAGKGDPRTAAAWREAAAVLEKIDEQTTDESLRAKLRGRT